MVEHNAHEVRGGSFEGLNERAELPHAAPDHALSQRFEHRLLALAVEIDRALADAGPARDVLHARGGKALFGKAGEAGTQDFRGPLVLPPSPAWLLVHWLTDRQVI